MTIAHAIIVPNLGTVVLRADGSAAIVDRNRQQFIIAAELVAAIIDLATKRITEAAITS